LREVARQQDTPFPRLSWEKEVLLWRTAGIERWGSERSAAVKKRSGINGLLPALRASPFHLFRLPLDLRCDVLKTGNCHFSAGKVRLHFSSSG
jgi:hypothetical protein